MNKKKTGGRNCRITREKRLPLHPEQADNSGCWLEGEEKVPRKQASFSLALSFKSNYVPLFDKLPGLYFFFPFYGEGGGGDFLSTVSAQPSANRAAAQDPVLVGILCYGP